MRRSNRLTARSHASQGLHGMRIGAASVAEDRSKPLVFKDGADGRRVFAVAVTLEALAIAGIEQAAAIRHEHVVGRFAAVAALRQLLEVKGVAPLGGEAGDPVFRERVVLFD